jgi:hypothetical protein
MYVVAADFVPQVYYKVFYKMFINAKDQAAC